MSKDPIYYLKHIEEECLYILEIINKGTNLDEFLMDETLKRAIARSLEIIGEAGKKVLSDFKMKWNSIRWHEMTGMRNRLIHDYMGMNYRIVWDVAKTKYLIYTKKLLIY